MQIPYDGLICPHCHADKSVAKARERVAIVFTVVGAISFALIGWCLPEQIKAVTGAGQDWNREGFAWVGSVLGLFAGGLFGRVAARLRYR